MMFFWTQSPEHHELFAQQARPSMITLHNDRVLVCSQEGYLAQCRQTLSHVQPRACCSNSTAQDRQTQHTTAHHVHDKQTLPGLHNKLFGPKGQRVQETVYTDRWLTG